MIRINWPQQRLPICIADDPGVSDSWPRFTIHIPVHGFRRQPLDGGNMNLVQDYCHNTQRRVATRSVRTLKKPDRFYPESNVMPRCRWRSNQTNRHEETLIYRRQARNTPSLIALLVTCPGKPENNPNLGDSVSPLSEFRNGVSRNFNG
jgi:hypothetical protein